MVEPQLPNLMVYLQGMQWDEEHYQADVDLCWPMQMARVDTKR
jgi:hypothetical protein